jgi:hypothetical protein
MSPYFTNIANISFRDWRCPALDVVALQDQIQSLSPDQISVGVDPVPGVPTALVQGLLQASVDVDEQHCYSIRPWYYLWNKCCNSRKM